MSASREDYENYGVKWISKSDLRPKILKRFGIKATCKEIQSKRNTDAITGYVVTGGMGHKKRTPTYSVSILKELYGATN